jgi:hypothetical protein
MIGRLHAHGHEIDVRVCGELGGVGEGKPGTVMFGGGVGGGLAGRSNRNDFEVW